MGQQIKEVDINTPTVLLKGHCKEVEVRANGKALSTGVIYLPKRFIGKKFFMLLLPKDDEIIEKINTGITL